MTYAVKYSDNARAGDGEFKLAEFSLHVFASTAMTDAEVEAFYEELAGEAEVGLGAVAERLREKYGERLTGITVTT